MDNYVKINENIYRCIENVFELLNEKEENIETSSSKNSFKIINFEHLIGLECFWYIIIYCKEQNVRNKKI